MSSATILKGICLSSTQEGVIIFLIILTLVFMVGYWFGYVEGKYGKGKLRKKKKKS